jgi:hypothetical protein
MACLKGGRRFGFVIVPLVLVTGFKIGAAECISGKVTDQVSGTALEGVSVQITGTAIQATSGTDGRYSICMAGGSTIMREPVDGPALVRLMQTDHISLHTMQGRKMAGNLTYGAMQNLISRLPDGVYLATTARDNGQAVYKIVKTGAMVQYNQRRVRSKAAGVSPVLIEAEKMTLDGTYVLDPGYDGVRDVIKIDPNKPFGTTGMATTAFSGASGLYKVQFYTCPENDGASQVSLSIGSKVILNETLPTDPGYLRSTEKVYAAMGVPVNQGDKITITGTSATDGSANGGAYARVDKILFTDSNQASLEFKKAGYFPRSVNVTFGTTTTQDVQLEKMPDMGDKPGPHNTGPTGTLKTYAGPSTISASGATFENFTYNGMITIQANNVTLRNFKINSGTHYCINIKPGHSGIVIEDGELLNASTGILGMGYTARRLNIHDNSGDGLKPQGQGGDVTVEASWIHRIGKIPSSKMSTCWPDLDPYQCPHSDAFQIEDKNGTPGRLMVLGCNINIPHEKSPNAVYGYVSNSVFHGSGASYMLFKDCWVNGGTYTFSVRSQLHVQNCRFGRDYAYGIRKSGTVGSWTDNVWDDTGEYACYGNWMDNGGTCTRTGAVQ